MPNSGRDWKAVHMDSCVDLVDSSYAAYTFTATWPPLAKWLW